ncbi:ABC transporter ATP-binding protein [Bacillus sp. HNG]|uniref:ABC transporter ATP-binding protein n=1 Tax=Bacillus sp. HNG TaxID=2293325 RepID=UPI000E2F43A5|nr:energy-coupling factor transporter ATPase [Bacillus sp. HNG]RFB12653.1 ABC transporter ATP-binding protein [Bacillus sp. HNG]
MRTSTVQANPFVKIQNVSFQYPGSDTKVLNGASLTIEEGEFLAIIGGNGSGKSTLCKTMNGLIPRFYVGEFSGNVVVDGLDTSEHNVAKLSQVIGYVYQDFENQLLRPTVIDDASFAPLNYGLADFKERGKWALEVTGLSDVANEFTWQLSGGKKHLLALAGAIAMKPKLLIVDEPVSQLDPYHARQIYDVLKKLNETHGITIITIEHHAEFIADYCSNVVLMDKGKVIWKKQVRDALSRVDELVFRQIYPPQVTLAAYHVNKNAEYPITIEEAVEYFGGRIPVVDELENVKQESTNPILSLRDITVHYRSIQKQPKAALKNVSTTFFKGDKVALVGNNGSGKSTLLKVISGIVKRSDGDIEFTNLPITKFTPEVMSNHVAYIYQNPEEMFIDDSVRKEIEYYLKARKVEDYSTKVDRILADFDLIDLQDRDARLLSGGQQRRVSLAIGVAMSPSIIILDEPTANLDIATKNKVVLMLKKLEEHVDTVIIATHDMQLVAEWANRILVMHDGQLINDGSPEEVLSHEDILNRAGLIVPQIVTLSNQLQFPIHLTVESFVESWKLAKERGELVGTG